MSYDLSWARSVGARPVVPIEPAVLLRWQVAAQENKRMSRYLRRQRMSDEDLAQCVKDYHALMDGAPVEWFDLPERYWEFYWCE